MTGKRRPVTIKDVALASGCSWKTVSNVLNDRPGKAMDETRARVLNAVRDLNYQPNAIARGLANRRMNTIGLALPSAGAHLLSPFFSLVLGGIVDKTHEERQNIMLFTGDSWADSEQSLSSYRDGRCDGMLIFSPPSGSRIVEAMVEAEMSFVLFGEHSANPRVSSVAIDDIAGARSAAEYLLDCGHRRIAVLAGETDSTYVGKRVLGYQLALEERGFAFDPAQVHTCQHGVGHISAYIDWLFANPVGKRPTAIFCLHDELALLVMPELASRGINVPGEISVMGFDDVAAAATAYPKLTTMRQPLHEMGRHAVEILLRQIRDGEPSGQSKEFETNLVVRESVARLAGGSGN